MTTRGYAATLGAVAAAGIIATAIIQNGPGAPVPLPIVSATCSSQDAEGPCANALPGHPGFWVTRWAPWPPDQMPHSITLDLGEVRELAALVYVPRVNTRTDGTRPSGDMRDYRLEIDGQLVATGQLIATSSAIGERTVGLAGQRGRLVKLTVLSNTDATPYASAEEIRILGMLAEPEPTADCDPTIDPATGERWPGCVLVGGQWVGRYCGLTPTLRWDMSPPEQVTRERYGFKVYIDGALALDKSCEWWTAVDKETGDEYEQRLCLNEGLAVQRATDIEGRIVSVTVSAFNVHGEGPQSEALRVCIPRTYRRGE